CMQATKRSQPATVLRLENVYRSLSHHLSDWWEKPFNGTRFLRVRSKGVLTKAKALPTAGGELSSEFSAVFHWHTSCFGEVNSFSLPKTHETKGSTCRPMQSPTSKTNTTKRGSCSMIWKQPPTGE